VRDRRITGQQEVDPDTDRVADDAGTPLGRDRPQPSESLDRAPRARLRPVDAAPESRSRGGPAEVAIEALTSDRASLPLDGRTERPRARPGARAGRGDGSRGPLAPRATGPGHRATSSATRPARSLLAEVDVLHFGVQGGRVHPHLATEPALLVPAEGRLGMD